MSGRLARSAGMIGLATMTSRVLGLVRDAVQGAYFGTGAAADAFVLATRIPTLLRDLFAEGAMSAAFVPTFSRYLQKEGRDAAWRLGAQLINGLILVTGLLVVLGILLARPLVHQYAPGFADDPYKQQLTVLLTQINMPFLTLIAIAAAMMGMLNGLRQFFIPAMSPALYNLLFIASTAILTPVFMRLGIEPAMALSIGMLTGGLGQILVQVPLLRREGYRHQWILNPRDPGLRQILLLMGPGTIGAAAGQINLMVNTMLATAQDGAPTALSLAFRLMYLPIGIFGVSVATAAIPDMARHAADGNYDGMRATLSWGIRLMLMLSIPATVGLMALATPIVEMIYQRGAFGGDSTMLVAAALMFSAPGIIGYSLVKIVSPCFYAMKDARTPITISLVTIGLNLVLNIALNARMGFTGLALGTAIAANLNAGLLLIILSKRINGVDSKRIWVSLFKILAAAAIMAAAVYVANGWLRTALPGTGELIRGIRVMATIALGIATLAASAWGLRIEEFRVAVQRVRGKLGL